MTRHLLLLLLLACGFGASLSAQGAPAIPSDVDGVAAGGYWTKEGDDGEYRLIIVSGGYEEVTSRAYLQWLSRPQSEDDTVRVVASVELTNVGGGNFHLYDPQFVRLSGHWQLTLRGVSTAIPLDTHCEWTVRLGPPGQYSASLTKNAVR